MYDRKPQNSAKQFSFNLKKIFNVQLIILCSYKYLEFYFEISHLITKDPNPQTIKEISIYLVVVKMVWMVFEKQEGNK